MDLKEIGQESEQINFVQNRDKEASTDENDNEPLGSIKCRDILDY